MHPLTNLVFRAYITSVPFDDPGTYIPERNFGLRLFKPIAQRILEMRSKPKPGTQNSSGGKMTLLLL